MDVQYHGMLIIHAILSPPHHWTLAQYQPASQGLQLNKVWPSSDDHQLCVACSKTEEGWLVVFGHVISLRVEIRDTYTTHSKTTACLPKVCALF